MGFPRREYWSELPFPAPGDLPGPRIQPALAGGFFTTEPPGKPTTRLTLLIKKTNTCPPPAHSGFPLKRKSFCLFRLVFVCIYE